MILYGPTKFHFIITNSLRVMGRGHNLKQVIHIPTSGLTILDFIITYLHTLYDKPRILSPLVSGDHSIVLWFSSAMDSTSRENITKPMKRLVRRYPQTQVNAFGRWLCMHSWFSDVGHNGSADGLAIFFSYHLIFAHDRFFPLKSVKCHYSDKPWMTPSIKELTRDRRKAFHSLNV